MTNLTPIERIAAPSPEEFEARYVKRSQPVILPGMLDDWPAMRLWSCEYFKRRFGDRAVPAVCAKDRARYDPQAGLHYEQIRLADYVGLLATGRAIDAQSIFPVHEVIPEP